MPSVLLPLSRLAAPADPPPGTRLAEARHALSDWSHRSSTLPWHRRAARREARMMIAAARAELIGAHLEQWGLGPLAQHVTPLLDTRGRDAGAHLRSLALNSMRRTAIGRRILLVVAGVAVVSLAVLGVAAALFAHALI